MPLLSSVARIQRLESHGGEKKEKPGCSGCHLQMWSLPLHWFAPSQVSPWTAVTRLSKLYSQSKTGKSWSHHSTFSAPVPKLFVLSFHQQSLGSTNPFKCSLLTSSPFCCRSLPSPESLWVQCVWWTGWVLIQSYPHTACLQFSCSVSVKTLRYSSTSIFWKMLVLPSDFKSPIIHYSFSESLHAFPSRNHHLLLLSAWVIISSPA